MENINSIFETKDFSIEYDIADHSSHRFSFRDDYVSYFSDQPTQRKDISYDEATLVNNFVQKLFNRRESNELSQRQLIIYNDSKKIILNVPDADAELEQLLDQLQLPYVPTKKK
jgi:hypothetical protein